jgi:hypothetical protein
MYLGSMSSAKLYLLCMQVGSDVKTDGKTRCGGLGWRM